MKTLFQILLVALTVTASSQTFAYGLAPCEMKKKFAAMPIPANTPIAMVSGHEFRKNDICVPISITAQWTNKYRAFPHTLYDMSAQEVYPGEFWYRTDREEFVLVADGKSFSGHDRLMGLSASGEACNHSYDQVCDKWTSFSTAHARPVNIADSETGAFLYSFPAVVTHEEEILENLDIMPPHFEFYKNAKEYSRPPMLNLTNLTRIEQSPFLYKDLVLAATKKKIYSKTVTWKYNEDAERNPSHNEGSVSFQISFSPSCPTHFQIVSPEYKQKYVFSKDNQGSLVIEAEAGEFENFPPDLVQQITWTAPAKAGSRIFYEPEDRKGKKIKITYEKLPQKNSDFGSTNIIASVNISGKCGTLSDSREVELFFPRDERNNTTGNQPNYYYYWLQTKAGNNAANGQDVRFMNRTAECGKNPHWLGYHPRETRLSVLNDPQSQPLLVGANHIFICDFHKYDNAYENHPSKNFFMKGTADSSLSWEGIDTFGVIMKHELQHRQNWRDWWSPKGYPKQGFFDLNNDRQKNAGENWLDEDEDFMPDAKEVALSYERNNKNTYNTPGEEMYDEHHYTYTVGEQWEKGCADREDWAKPGKQWPGED